MPEINHMKLSELTRKVSAVIQESFGSNLYWIIAEIASHKFYANQDRHYFDFVEKSETSNEPIAKISGKAWSNGSQKIKWFEQQTGQLFKDGIQVLVKVKVEFHITYGFSLILNDIDPSFTLGNIELQRRNTLLKLVTENAEFIQKVGENFATKNKKIKFNSVIQNIAIIGSPNSEGYKDFTHTIQSNQFKYKFKIDIYQSSVQGVEAENELVNKLIAIYNSGVKYDCVVIIRGGGAKTDFIVFDTYNVSRAVAKFPIPIITGIGHYMDVSIVDLMANTNTKTPTKAAEFIISHNRSFEELLVQHQKNVAIKSQQLVNNSIQRVSAVNLVIVNKSRTFLSRFKDNLTGINQTLVNKTKSIINIHQTNLVSQFNQTQSKSQKLLSNSVQRVSSCNLIIVNSSRTYLSHFKGGLNDINQTVVNKTKSIVFNKKTNLVSLLNQILSQPKIITAEKKAELVNLINNFKIFSVKYLVNKKGYLGHYESVIRLTSPKNILKRGFAIVSQNGKIQKNAEGISPSSELLITMYDFDINTKVISKTKTDGTKPDL